jgi:8-oxo-dGTP pyrophosphatase MutT (NUDIX family)
MRSEIGYRGYFTLEIMHTADGPREVLRGGDSACVLIYERASRRAILVRQPRVTMIRDDNRDGMLTEAVAGRFDAAYGVKELIAKEAWEEAGVRLDEDRIELLNHGEPVALTAGATDERCYLAYAEVGPDDVEAGEHERGAEGEGEHITRVFVSADDVEGYVCEDARVYGLLQYLLRRLDR